MARDSRLKVILEGKDNASGVIGKAQGRFSKFATFLSTRFVFTLGEVTRTIGALFRQIEESANLQGQTNALRRQLAAQGQSFDEFIAKLNQVADSTVSTADLVSSSANALLLGIPATEIAALLEIARASSVAAGTSVKQAFDDIVRGIGRASPLILDNLGIVVNLNEAYSNLADRLGTTVAGLTQQQKSQALLSEVLEKNAGRVEQFSGAQVKLAIALQQGAAQLANFRVKVGEFGGAIALLTGGVLSTAANGVLHLVEGFVKLEIGMLRVISRVRELSLAEKQGLLDAVKLDDALDDQQKTLSALSESLTKSGNAAFSAAAGFQKLGEEAGESRANLQGLEAEAEGLEPALDEILGTTGSLADENFRLAGSYDRVSGALQGFTREAQRAQESGAFEPRGSGGIPLITTAPGEVAGLTREQQLERTRFAVRTASFSAGFADSLINQGRTSQAIGINRDTSGGFWITRTDGSRVLIPEFGGRSGTFSLGNAAL